ncbi:MAG: precorrin-3B synthase, partial [Alphaproteobacteria bacterium HGW-Alphaproteobacteria-6]
MSAPKIQGWCPGALRPMLSGDGLVVRVRPHGGRLTQGQMSGIADLAARHGNGLIDLSARANVQIRGVGEAGHAALIDGLGALDLIDDSLAAETRRNIVVQPFWVAGDDTRTVIARLEAALAAA